MSDSLPSEAGAFLDGWLGEGWKAEELAGDASTRRYYRVTARDGSRFVVAYYPETVRRDAARFLAAFEAIEGHARVPGVLRGCDFAIAQTDVGDETLFHLLHRDRQAAIPLYRDSIDLLVSFQQAPAAGINPPFDAGKFFEELEMTREFYVERLLHAVGGSELSAFFRGIAEKIAAHPYLLCHRDYHGQNLHVLGGHIFMIDYQDLRLGPDTYDLASLLRDRGAAEILGRDTEERLIEYYREATGTDARVRRRYFETLLQRSIKTVGTFAKQALTRGRLHYLDYIPPALASVRQCLVELTELEQLADVFPMELGPQDVGRLKESLGGAPAGAG